MDFNNYTGLSLYFWETNLQKIALNMKATHLNSFISSIISLFTKHFYFSQYEFLRMFTI